MKLMTIDVLHIAKLANLPLGKDEIEKYEKQLSSILAYIEKLKSAKTVRVAETSQVTNLENVTRDDEPDHRFLRMKYYRTAIKLKTDNLKLKQFLNNETKLLNYQTGKAGVKNKEIFFGRFS